MELLIFIIVVLVIGLFGCACYSRRATTINATPLPRVRNRLLGMYSYVGIPWYEIELKSYTFAPKDASHSNLVAQRYLYGQPYEDDFELEYWDEGIYRWKYPTNNMWTYFTVKQYDPIVIEQTSEHNPTYTLLKTD